MEMRRKWIKRAVVGAAVAAMGGAGIAVAATASAATGDIVTLTVRGLTEADAQAAGRGACESGGMDYAGPSGAAVLVPGSLIGAGEPDQYELSVQCVVR